MLFTQGVSDYGPLRCDRRRRLEELRTGDGRPLRSHLKTQIRRELDWLELLLQEIKAGETERDALLAAQRVTARAPATMLLDIKGIGPEFAAILWSEGLFRHFDNRRQVASYAGLAPTPWQSGSANREQGVSKAGTRDCDQRSSSLLGYGCAISRNQSRLCGLKNGSGGTAAILKRRPSWRWRESCWWRFGNADEAGATDKGCDAIDDALKGRGVLVVLGVKPSDRLDGLFDMGRQHRRSVRIGHGLSSTI